MRMLSRRTLSFGAALAVLLLVSGILLSRYRTQPSVEFRLGEAPASSSALNSSSTGQPSSAPPSVRIDVPFTSQAPFKNWDALHEEACEEASLLMVRHSLEGTPFTDAQAEKEIQDLVRWETAHGLGPDITAAQVARVAGQLYGYKADVYGGSGVTLERIKNILARGQPLIFPVDGRQLHNPYYSGDGPPYHMLVVIGYDENHLIANDPGTRRGERYAYDADLFLNAIHDWTGNKATMPAGKKAMVAVRSAKTIERHE